MAKKRRSFSKQFKFKVALEAVRGLKTLNQIAAEHQLHPNQVSQWKQQLLREGSAVFNDRGQRSELDAAAARETELYEHIGRLKMELEWLKKKVAE
jgi:putative transposase